MKERLIGLFILTIIISTTITVTANYKMINNDENLSSFKNILNKGKIIDKDGVPILYVSGSFYEMGYQHGFYLQDEIKENIRAFRDYCERHGYSYEKVLEVWEIQEKYMPDVYIEEIQGMADGLNISFEEVAVHNTWMGVFNHLFSCWGAAMWGDATSDGNLIHIRSCDGVNMIKDPVTGTYLSDNQVVIIRNPDNAYASLSPIFSGDIISIGGFNEMGVGVSELTILGKDTTFHGINAGFRMRMVLDFADDAYEAVDIMNSNRTCCWNFIVSDGSIPIGFAIEQSANYAYANTWYDKIEGIDPFWQIKDVVRRGNCYINPVLADFQRKFYDPSGLKGYLRTILRIDYTFFTWVQYKAISNEIDNQYSTITVDSAIRLLRNVYLGKTDLLFWWFLANKSETGRQWAACPKTGDFTICFADNYTEAYTNHIQKINLFDLLNSEK